MGRARGSEHDGLVQRCAWCDRVFVAGGWQSVEDHGDVVAHLLGRLTHTICPDCAERLRAEGLSH